MAVRKYWLCCCLLIIGLITGAQQPKLILPVGHAGKINAVSFSPDGKTVATISADGTAKLWETTTGKLLRDFPAGGDASGVPVSTVTFSPDGKEIVIGYEQSYSKIAAVASGNFFWNWLYNEHDMPVYDAINHFSPNGKKMILFEPQFADSTIPFGTPTIYDVATQKPVLTLKGNKESLYKAAYSPDGKKIVTAGGDSTIRIWDAITARLLLTIPGQGDAITTINFSADNKRLCIITASNTIKLLDAITGKKIIALKIPDPPPGANQPESAEPPVNVFYFRPDGKRLLVLEGLSYFNNNESYTIYDSLSFWDLEKGRILFTAACRIPANQNDFFSADGKKLLVIRNNNSVAVWNTDDGKINQRLTGFTSAINTADFSPDGKNILTADDSTLKIWDAASGKLLQNLKEQTGKLSFAQFSPDGKKIITVPEGNDACIWDAIAGKKLTRLTGRSNELVKADYSADGSKIIIELINGKQVWDIATGKLLFEKKQPAKNDSANRRLINMQDGIRYSNDSSCMVKFMADYLTVSVQGMEQTVRLWTTIKYASFSTNNKKLLLTLSDNTIRQVDAHKIAAATSNITGDADFVELTFISIDSADYLITDAKSRYDGTEAARKLLYFTCGNEVIELDQLKDQLWIPNLAARIYTGETINAKSLDQLNLCGLTPLVEDISTAGQFHFTVTPRRGGLGETVLLINGIEAKRYKKEQLKKTLSGYELIIKKDSLSKLLIAGQQNPVLVKAYTTGNAISSRGAVVVADQTKNVSAPPNLYAVMIGVSDYKGDELDLKYAAKDATDISAAIASAAKKLLNTGDSNHVFMYNLTTEKTHYLLPEKISIKKTLEEIGKKASANDILLVFFAGHGVMAGDADKKQFYFLSSDASSLSATSAVQDVGISTAELAEWMKPQNIKAQKRILIFDACQSGQAINDFVKMGNDDQRYIAARNDDKSQQTKAIDKLNEKSGLFILSASASTQSAYEMGRFSQGLLTYSLLKAIKQQPDILDQGKYLDVSRWFDAAGKTVSELVKESGARQDPQIVSNTNFDIGIVDAGVMSAIVLPEEKPLFAASNFQNSDEAIADDDLEFSQLINLQLNDLSARGAESKIVYVTATNLPDAWSLSGRYTVKGNIITVKVNVKQNKEIKSRFEISGATDKLHELTAQLVAKAAAWTGKNR